MAKAKRGQGFDPNRGKTIPTFKITVSKITGKFLVVIQYGKQSCVISPHRKIEGARHGIKMCKECLTSFPEAEIKGSLNTWLKKFIGRINSDFMYEDDDEILGLLHDLGDKGLFMDCRKTRIDEATAEANMRSIHLTGQKLYN